jgi:hypothetical protein
MSSEILARRTEAHAVLAFYGLPKPMRALVARKGFERLISLLNEQVGREPDLIGLRDSDQFKSYKRMKKKIAADDSSTRHGFSVLYRTHGVADAHISFDCLLMTTFNVDSDGFCILDTRSTLFDLHSLMNMKIPGEICSLFTPRYGIGYEMRFDKGSELYALGMGLGLDDMFGDPIPDRDYWQQATLDDLYLRHRLLREVYPLNFLTGIQLDAPVHQRTLRSWIESEHRNGTLLSITQEVTLWKVD